MSKQGTNKMFVSRGTVAQAVAEETAQCERLDTIQNTVDETMKVLGETLLHLQKISQKVGAPGIPSCDESVKPADDLFSKLRLIRAGAYEALSLSGNINATLGGN